MVKEFKPFTLHQEEEEAYKNVAKALRSGKHPLANELDSLALLNTRTRQFLAATCALTGRTVRIYDAKNKLAGRIHRCVVTYSTATCCFALCETNMFGVVINTIEVTPETNLFVESFGE